MAGDLIHFEIRAADAERAQGFWSSLFGWKFNARPSEAPYTMTRAGGEGPTGGLYRSESGDRGLVPYFSVAHGRRSHVAGRQGERSARAGSWLFVVAYVVYLIA